MTGFLFRFHALAGAFVLAGLAVPAGAGADLGVNASRTLASVPAVPGISASLPGALPAISLPAEPGQWISAPPVASVKLPPRTCAKAKATSTSGKAAKRRGKTKVAARCAPVRTMALAQSMKMPFTGTFFNECAGEFVALEGDSHIVLVFTQTDPTTPTHTTIKTGFNFQNVKGVGLSSGSPYASADVTETVLGFDAPFPATNTVVQQLILNKLQRTSPNEDLIMGLTFHITLNNNGVMTASVDNPRLKCRG